MIRQLSFIHDGKRYVTIFGATDFLKSHAQQGSNVCDAIKIQSSGGASRAFKSIAGVDVREVPMINNPEVSIDGVVYTVTGTAEVDGVVQPVRVTATEIVVDNGEPEPEPEPVPEEEPEVVEEVKESEEPEEVEEEPEPIPVPVVVPKLIVPERASQPEPIMPNPAVVPPQPAPTSGITLRASKVSSIGMQYAKPVEPKRGLQLGVYKKDGIRELAPGLCIGSPNSSTKGISFGKVSRPVPAPEPEQEPVTVYEEPTPEPVAEPTEEEVNEDLMKKWRETTPISMSEQWNVPEETVSTNAEPEMEDLTPVKDNKQIKEALRATYSDDINAIIGQIPHAILGPIAEFTLNEVDVHKLEIDKDMYCIDNRWHKCGKWYCVDVVNSATRYFFNARLQVSIAIPVSVCKEWLEAVS